MAQKLLKAKKRKIVPKGTMRDGTGTEPKKIVLVGTYAGDQLKDWPGYYPYPLSADDKVDPEYCKKVNEIWLFKGTKEPKYFAAEYLGVKTRDELKALGYPVNGKGHGDGTYLLFKIAKTYAPANTSAALAASVESVIVRTKDFARTPTVRKQLKDFLESPERKDKGLASQLPSIVLKLPREVLCVCEAAVQLDFFQIMYPERVFPATASIVYVEGAIKRHPRTEVVEPQTDNNRPFRLGEFFCGPGGLACGALSATIENPNFKIEHAWSNDYDQQTCNTYAENICRDCPETVICYDVRKLDLEDHRLTPIDGFAFGFPCMKVAA